MKRKFIIIGFFALSTMLVSAGVALADESPVVEAQAAQGPVIRSADHRPPEIKAIDEAERLAVRELLNALKTASSPEEREAIQQRIISTKKQAMIQRLEFHLDKAEQQGDTKEVSRLRKKIAALKGRVQSDNAPVARPSEAFAVNAPSHPGEKGEN